MGAESKFIPYCWVLNVKPVFFLLHGGCPYIYTTYVKLIIFYDNLFNSQTDDSHKHTHVWERRAGARGTDRQSIKIHEATCTWDRRDTGALKCAHGRTRRQLTNTGKLKTFMHDKQMHAQVTDAREIN